MSVPGSFVDRSSLGRPAYRTSPTLRDREALYRYASRGLSLPDWVFDQVEAVRPLAAAGRFLDVGWGRGGYVESLLRRRADWITTGIDLSPAMAAEAARRGGAAAVGDATALPVRDATCDLVLAAHLLHHVPLPQQVVAELARVCRPGGIVVIVSNGPGHQVALRELVNRAAGTTVWRRESPGAEDAVSRVAGVLSVVAAETMNDEIRVDRAGPVLSYVQSIRPLVEPRLRGFTNWTMTLARVRAALDEALERDGEWTSAIERTVFVCRHASAPADS
jgi:SAM-dependent methyltransferase